MKRGRADEEDFIAPAGDEMFEGSFWHRLVIDFLFYIRHAGHDVKIFLHPDSLSDQQMLWDEHHEKLPKTYQKLPMSRFFWEMERTLEIPLKSYQPPINPLECRYALLSQGSRVNFPDADFGWNYGGLVWGLRQKNKQYMIAVVKKQLTIMRERSAAKVAKCDNVLLLADKCFAQLGDN